MSIYDRSINIMASLEPYLIPDRPIIFICHSYGGLLVKQMLRSARDAPEYLDICNRTKAIVFAGTPHAGSSLASFVDAISLIYRSAPAVKELKANSPALLDLNRWFRAHFSELNLSLLVFAEDQKTKGVLVVDAVSSDPGIAGVTPVKIDCNHIELSKPAERSDVRVFRVNRLVKSIVDATNDTRSPTGSDQVQVIVYFIERCVREMASGSPAENWAPPYYALEETAAAQMLTEGKVTEIRNFLRLSDEYAAIPSGLGQAVERRRWARDRKTVQIGQALVRELHELMVY
ncbi:hypothetical protein [Rhizobium sp. YS-1r]|uniref:hypothetical protein n=1 Tax=Rhizobium sp. YS-1r TaxID=1532558 RepID=UPI0006906B62|nr:hypothetical protein [Rhizobium sp. YS-1r]